MAFIKPFSGIGKEDAGIAGGKGASLGEMTQAGIPVPPGYVILAETFEEFVHKADLEAEIAAALDTVNHEEMHTVDAASERIQGVIMNAQMPADIAADIRKNFAELGAEYVAVRSSATAEDSASAAWAGQLDTYLNTTDAELLTNVQRCWASLFTPRAIFYRFEKGLHATKISVAVVVQKMVQSDASGIAFSVHPVTEDHNQLIIEASWGLGEAIVSGQVTPDSYVVSKSPREIIEKNIATKERGLYRAPAGGNDWQEVPKDKQEVSTLTDAQVAELSQIIIGIENHYGFPCDIEWAMESDVFYITQSRPITTLAHVEAPVVPAECVGREYPQFVHDYGVPLNPWSLLLDIFNDVLPRLDERAKPVDSIFYFSDDEVFWGPDREQFEQAADVFNTKLAEDSAFAKTLVTKTQEAIVAIERYVKNELLAADFAKASDAELLRLFKGACNLHIELWVWGIVGQFLEMGDAKFSEQFKERNRDALVAHGDAEEVYAKLLTPLDPFKITEENEAVLTLLAEVQADAALRAALEKAATIADVPAPLAQKLHALATEYGWLQYYYLGPAASADYYFTHLKARNSAVNAAAELAERAPALQALKDFQEKVESPFTTADKHSMEQLRALGYIKEMRKEGLYFINYGLDGWYAEIARRFKADPAHTRYILKEEYEEILSGKKTFPSTDEMTERRRGCACMSFGGKHFLKTGADALLYKQVLKDIRPVVADANTILGSVAYAGIARGRAIIVNTAKDMEKFSEGDILISIATTPVLVPAMNKAAAIVTDVGGVTCHAAIVSRELKIPCIVGTKIATQVIQDGDMVEVDAQAGVLRKL